MPERLDSCCDLGDGIRAFELRKVVRSTCDALELKPKVDTHERVDEQLAGSCSRRELCVAETSSDSRSDRAIDDAGALWGESLGMGNGVDKRGAFI